MNITTVLWTTVGIAAFIELARLYYRVHMLEQHLDQLLNAIDRAISKKA